MLKRPEKDQYYLNIARVVATRSTCLKVQMGAIIVKEDQIIATGYAGAPRHTRSSMEHNFCLRKKLKIPSGTQYELCRSVHAARAGVSLLGGDMFIYGQSQESQQAIDAFPCFICKKMIINCGLKRVICSVKDNQKQVMVFFLEDWIHEWQENDIIEDKFKYGANEGDTRPLDGVPHPPVRT